MPLTSALLIAAVRATIRLVGAGDSALSQYVRDRDQLVPDANVDGLLFVSNAVATRGAFGHDPAMQKLLEKDPALRAAWEKFQQHDKTEIPVLQKAIARQKLTEKYGSVTDAQLENLAFGERLRQWDPKDPNRPLEPWERFAVALADVALEFVGANPGILGVGGNGEKLIGAFAENVSELIPDDGAYGPQQFFGERVLGIVLRAGLQTVVDKPGFLFDETHLQQLVKNVATPVLAAFDNKAGLAEQVRWQNVVDAVLGPASSAAFKTLAENEKAFLGAKFDPEKAVGALTASLLKTVADNGLDDVFTKNGLIALYTSAVGVVADRPELFLGKSGDAKDKFFSDLLGGVAKVLRELGTELQPRARHGHRHRSAG